MLALLGSASASVSSIAATEQTTPNAARPNIVLIVTDDQGYGDCSSNGNTDLQTPFMDEIARNGVRFTQFRVQPLCAPTRASVMTGLDALASGMWRGPADPKNGQHPVHGVSLLAHAQSKAKTPLPDRYLFWDLYGDCGALHGKWTLVGQIDNHGGEVRRAVMDAEKKTFELYNLEEDIGEKNDLAKKHPEIYADLKHRHLEWLRQFAIDSGPKTAGTDSGKLRKKKKAANS